MGALTLGAALTGGCTAKDPLVEARAETPLFITGAAVLDVVDGSRAEGLDVLVRDGRIASITSAGSVPPPADARVLDGAGATVMPGLVDSHVHSGAPVGPPWRHGLPEQDRILQAYLYCGVTTVLDTGGMDDVALRLRDEVEAGARLGPRMFAVGPVVTAEEGHPVPMLRILPWWQRVLVIPRQTRQLGAQAEASEIAAVVDEIAGYDADFIKVAVDRLPDAATPRLSLGQLQKIGAEARRAGLRVLAHIGTTEDALDAARAGAAAWIHGVNRGRIPDEAIPALAAYGIPMVATLVVFDHYSELGRAPPTPTALELETQGADMFAALGAPPEGDPMVERFRPFMDELRDNQQNRLDNVRRLHEAGVVILAGSDTQAAVVPGASLHRELSLLVQAGLSPLQAIQSATVLPARFLTQNDDPPFGVLAPGKEADLLLVEGDPLADIRVVSRIRAVVARGRLLERTPHR